MTENLGLFNQFWDDHPRHLPLLSLVQRNLPVKPWDLNSSLARLDQILLNNPHDQLCADIGLLLNSDNWRAHLVATCAIFKIPKGLQQSFVNDLWQLVENVSWVNPQIIASLSIIDQSFKSNANQLYIKLIQKHKNGQVINEKLNCLLVFFLEGKIIAEDVFENHATIAQTWKENLLYLIDAGIFTVDQEAVSFPKLPGI